MRILIISDQPPLTESLQRALEREGHHTDVVHDASCLRAAAETNYDVAYLDIAQAARDGYRVLERLRGREQWMPVLLTSANVGANDDLGVVVDDGADPFPLPLFAGPAASLRSRALRERPGVPALITVGRLTIDPVRGRCVIDDVDVLLTQRECELLAYLVLRRGEVIPKQELLENVWRMSFDTKSKVVEVYISYLRKKIDRRFQRASIRTIRGVGYEYVDSDSGAPPPP